MFSVTLPTNRNGVNLFLLLPLDLDQHTLWRLLLQEVANFSCLAANFLHYIKIVSITTEIFGVLT